MLGAYTQAHLSTDEVEPQGPQSSGSQSFLVLLVWQQPSRVCPLYMPTACLFYPIAIAILFCAIPILVLSALLYPLLLGALQSLLLWAQLSLLKKILRLSLPHL